MQSSRLKDDFDVAELRDRLRKMSDAELLWFEKAARYRGNFTPTLRNSPDLPFA